MSYSKIDPLSHSTVASSLDLFKPPPTKTSTFKSRSRQISPIGDADGSQLIFDFHTSSFEYWDPDETRLVVTACVQKADGTALPGADTVKVVPVSNLLHNLFARASLSINNNEVSYQPDYPTTAYLERLLSQSSAYKKTIARSALWLEDGLNGKNTDQLRDDGETEGARKALIATSKDVEMCDRLNLPFLNQERYVISNASINLTLTRADPKMALLRTDPADTTDYKIKISKCFLLVSDVTVHPSIINSHNALLTAGKEIMYPLNDIETQTYTIPAGQMSARLPIRINQQYPKRVTIALIDHEAKNGHLAKDAFRFQPFRLRKISLDVDGTPVPGKPVEMDFAAGTIAHAYHNLATATGKAQSGDDNGITMEQFADSCAVFVFDLTPDSCEGGGVHLINFGSVTLELVFAAALAQTVSAFILLERDELLKFNQERVLSRLPRI